MRKNPNNQTWIISQKHNSPLRQKYREQRVKWVQGRQNTACNSEKFCWWETVWGQRRGYLSRHTFWDDALHLPPRKWHQCAASERRTWQCCAACWSPGGGLSQTAPEKYSGRVPCTSCPAGRIAVDMNDVLLLYWVKSSTSDCVCVCVCVFKHACVHACVHMYMHVRISENVCK